METGATVRRYNKELSLDRDEILNHVTRLPYYRKYIELAAIITKLQQNKRDAETPEEKRKIGSKITRIRHEYKVAMMEILK